MGLDAAREAVKKIQDVEFDPKETELGEPKEGKDDPNNEEHQGGNTWAGGVGSSSPFIRLSLTSS